MNGGDGRLVQAADRHVEAPAGSRGRLGQDLVQDLRRFRIQTRCRGVLPALPETLRLPQPGTDAALQFGGGGAGVGEHQNVVNLQRPLHDQAQNQQTQRPGLARAGAGLQEQAAGEGQTKGIKRLHWLPPLSWPTGAAAARPDG